MYQIYCHIEFVIFIHGLFKHFILFTDVDRVIHCKGILLILVYYLPFYIQQTKHSKFIAPRAPQCNLFNYLFINLCKLYHAMYFREVYDKKISPGYHTSTHINPRLRLGLIWKRSCINIYLKCCISKYYYNSLQTIACVDKSDVSPFYEIVYFANKELKT